MSANAELNKQLESGQEEIAKLEQEKKVYQVFPVFIVRTWPTARHEPIVCHHLFCFVYF